MTDTARNYREQGFLLCRDFFEREQVAAVRREAQAVFVHQLQRFDLLPAGPVSDEACVAAMARLFREQEATFINCGKVCQHLIGLHRLSLEARIVAQLNALGLESPVICTRPVLYFNARALARSEVYYKTPPHQDWRSMQGSLNAVVVWVPLVDIDRPLGALEIIPGSHRLGLLDSEADEWYRRIPGTRAEDYVAVEVKAGDALFFSSFLVHRSGDNTTDAIRWSCHFRYNDLAEPTYRARGFPSPYVYKPQQELITPGFPSVAEVGQLFADSAPLLPSPPVLGERGQPLLPSLPVLGERGQPLLPSPPVLRGRGVGGEGDFAPGNLAR